MATSSGSEVNRGDRLLVRAIGVVAALLVVAVLVLVATYYVQRYYHPTVAVVDRDIAAMEEQIRLHPQDTTLRVNAAYLFIDKGRYDDAIAQLQPVLQSTPDDFSALQAMGMAYAAKKDTAQAITYFQKAVDLNKDNPMAKVSRQLASLHAYLGQAYFEEGKIDQAIVELRQAADSDSTNADALRLLGDALVTKRDFSGATSAYQRAIQLVPDFREAYAGLAKDYQATGDNAGAKYANAMVTLMQGDTAQAITELKAVAADWSQHAELHLGLAMAYERSGQREEALSEYEEAARLAPDSVAAQHGISRLEAGTGH